MPSSTAARFALLFVALQVVYLLPTKAQVSGGTISGTVVDASGGVVPNTKIIIRSQATDTVRNVVSNKEGFYTAPNLSPGEYSITAVASGFEEAVATVILTVGAEKTLNLSMRVGKVTEKVDITQTIPPVDLATSAINDVVTGNTIRALPLNGRSWTDLVTLQPGVAQINSLAPITSDERGDRGFGVQVTINGGRPQQNNYRLDGVSINDNSNGGPGSVLGGNLGVDAIQEFSVLTTNYAAEYGRTSGGVVNAITRSGTNQIHGSAYEFLRNSALDARNFFDTQKAPFRRNQFGAAGGGPIRKDRTFVFADYEGIRQGKGVSSESFVPSAAARAGHLCSAPDGSCTPTTVTVDPSAQKYLGLFPVPNAGVLSGGDIGIFNFAPNQTTIENYTTLRVDHRFNERDNLFGTYVHDDANSGSPDALNLVQYGSTTNRQTFVLEETHIFRSFLVNSVRLGFNRAATYSFGGVSAINPLAKDPSLAAVPGEFAASINITGLTHMGGGVAPNKNYIWNSYQFYDDAFLTHGAHSFKFGFAFERMQLNELLTVSPTGTFTFGSLLDFLTNGRDPNSQITFQADFPNAATPRYIRQSLFGGYAQDDWHPRPNLTLNIGLRYEMTTVPTETQNRLATLINISDPTPHLGNPFFHNPTYLNFEPRVGFAWDPFHNGKTALRGGFGIFDVLPLPYEFEFLTRAAPFYESGALSHLPPGSFYSGAYPLLGVASLRQIFVEQNPSRNYVMQWNFNIQRELTKNLSALIAYVGSRGVHQPFRADDADTVLPCNLELQPGCPPPTTALPGLFWPSPIGSGTKINPNFGDITALKWAGDSYFHALEIQLKSTLRHGLSVQGAFTWSKSIDTSSSVVLGDAFESAISSPYWWNLKVGRGLSDFNVPRNFEANFNWQVPRSQSLSGVAGFVANGWEMSGIVKASDGLPFSATFGTDGDPLGLNSNDPFDYPNRLVGPGCTSLINPGNPANYVKTQCFAIPTVPSALYGYCDPRFGTSPQCFNLHGNAGRNIIPGPGFFDLDYSLVKNNYVRRISEAFNIQFRAEVFNILNHPNFIPPKHDNIFDSTGAPVSSAGALTSTTFGNERQIQFALKVIW